MSLLSYSRLCELVEQGVIENVDFKDVNAGSIDLHLGPTLKAEAGPFENGPHLVDFSKRESLRFLEVDLRHGPFSLPPRGFCLAHTVEKFNLPDNVCAEYKLKSSMARVGLEHLNAGWCDAGWHGSVLTLELNNVTNYHAHLLTNGMPIGQIVFFECDPVPADRSYAARGRYNGDLSVQGIKE